MAVEVGRYTMQIQLPGGGTMTDNGKYVVVFSLQPDGTWKARIDIFNTSVPMTASPPAESETKK